MQVRDVPIAGERVTPTDFVEVENPYTRRAFARVPRCGSDEVDRACKGAEQALARRDFPAHARARVLERAADALRERSDELARLIATEAGKPLRTASAEVARAVDTFSFAAAEARTLTGELVPADASSAAAGKLTFALRVPRGVVAAITPFNFPLNLVAHKLAPALAAGCPVVLKPAPQTPLTALELVDLLVASGMPEDWMSVLTDSGKEAAEPLVNHPVPSVVSFTGSAAVGWSIAAAAPKKRVLLELGSSSPVIVEADADLDAAVPKIVKGAYGFAGQSCISVQRVVVQESVHDEVVARLKDAVSDLKLGDPLEESTDVGPLIRASDTERVRAWIEEATEGGGCRVVGGGVEGEILEPTIVDATPRDCRLWREEVFGPVCAVRSYSTFDEGIALANDTEMPIHAGLFTRDLSRALAAVRELRFGGVLVNEVPTFRTDQQPYGGVREAGNTREGPAYAARELTEVRFVSLEP